MINYIKNKFPNLTRSYNEFEDYQGFLLGVAGVVIGITLPYLILLI